MANERRNKLLAMVLVVVIVSSIAAYSLLNRLDPTITSTTFSVKAQLPWPFSCQDLSTGTTGNGMNIGNSYGTQDSKWILKTAPAGGGGNPPYAYSVDPTAFADGDLNWYSGPSPPIGPNNWATWISTGNPSDGSGASAGKVGHLGVGDYEYLTSFGSGSGTLVLILVAADDRVTLTLDAKVILLPSSSYMGHSPGMFHPSTPLSIPVLTPSPHTLIALVNNDPDIHSGLLVIAKWCAVWTYTAKFICNMAPLGYLWPTPSAAERIGLVPGEYKTDINVHNHNSTNSVFIQKKFVVSVPEPTMNNSMVTANNTKFLTTNLGPDGALRIDCAEILPLVYPGPYPVPPLAPPVKGWVVLTTNTTINQPPPLDVWAEYTVESFNNSNLPISDPLQVSTGVSIDIEQVTATASQ